MDAVKAVGKIPVDFHGLRVSSLALGGHKFHGPRGVGALLLRRDVVLDPLLHGGHQESGRRPGTEPVALACGMARALELWHRDHDARQRRLAAMRDRLQAGLQQMCDPVLVVGAAASRLPNTLSIAFPGLDGDAVLIALDLAGISCSLGSTCASGSSQPPPTLRAMGLPDDIAKSALRFSLSVENTDSEVEEAIRRISDVVTQLRHPR